jgi:hypothetical protein
MPLLPLSLIISLVPQYRRYESFLPQTQVFVTGQGLLFQPLLNNGRLSRYLSNAIERYARMEGFIVIQEKYL